MKTCPRCRLTKPLNEFQMNRKRGRPMSYCRGCQSAYQAEWRAKNREKQKAYKRKWESAHADMHRAAKRRRYRKDAARIQQRRKAWRERNRDLVRERSRNYAQRRRWLQVLRNWGLSQEEFRAMHKAQGGCCPICRRPIPDRGLSLEEVRSGVTKVHVDHCHTTGNIRGLLCGPCNAALGLFRDNPENLLRATRYLRKHA